MANTDLWTKILYETQSKDAALPCVLIRTKDSINVYPRIRLSVDLPTTGQTYPIGIEIREIA